MLNGRVHMPIACQLLLPEPKCRCKQSLLRVLSPKHGTPGLRFSAAHMLHDVACQRLEWIIEVRCAGVRASEAKAINLSLTVLGMCINARASNVPVHVPYRDSKLTRLLKVRAC